MTDADRHMLMYKISFGHLRPEKGIGSNSKIRFYAIHFINLVGHFIFFYCVSFIKLKLPLSEVKSYFRLNKPDTTVCRPLTTVSTPATDHTRCPRSENNVSIAECKCPTSNLKGRYSKFCQSAYCVKDSGGGQSLKMLVESNKMAK